MGKVYETVTDEVAAFIGEQKIFFVATAPKADDGLLNCSPKGIKETFKIIDPRTVAYLDFTGSGVETIAHLKENGRIVIMFCAFAGAPNILRIYGKGEVIEPHHRDFDDLRSRFDDYVDVRSIIRVDIGRIADACGFGVPLYEFRGERETLFKHARNKGPKEMAEYRSRKNRRSLDGLPGLDLPT
ncbi:MAG: pyridoxamine 5'-phosphate oxidase family protein [Ectothiorhodospiraceae bacterium AqS1]|nr:pyridoxamine 5'-phosphate oxidase family protein [Ectothiorhodospiraceae bacterium AqS1]